MHSIRGTYKHKTAILIEAKHLIELDALVKEYFANIEYQIIFQGGETAVCDTIDEILAIDNFDNTKIGALSITSRNGYDLWIKICNSPGFLADFDSTVSAEYKFDSMDKCQMFQEKLSHTLNKANRKKGYDLVAKYLSLFYLALSFTITLISFAYSKLSNQSTPSVEIALGPFVGIIIIAVILALAIFIASRKLKLLYPALVFNFGEEIKSENARSITKQRLETLGIGLLFCILGVILGNMGFKFIG